MINKTLTFEQTITEIQARQLMLSVKNGRLVVRGPALPFQVYKQIRAYSDELLVLMSVQDVVQRDTVKQI